MSPQEVAPSLKTSSGITEVILWLLQNLLSIIYLFLLVSNRTSAFLKDRKHKIKCSFLHLCRKKIKVQ